MTMTMRESATRHMAAGVMDLDELARLVEQDTGRAPNRRALSTSRSYFRRHGAEWVEHEREKCLRWRVDNPEKHREGSREAKRRLAVEDPARRLLYQYRKSSKQRGLHFALEIEDIEAMLAPMVCSVTGLPLMLHHDGGSTVNPWAPSIDRLDNSRGYEPGNVRMVCCAFNIMRNDFPDDVVRTLAAAVHGALNRAP